MKNTFLLSIILFIACEQESTPVYDLPEYRIVNQSGEIISVSIDTNESNLPEFGVDRLISKPVIFEEDIKVSFFIKIVEETEERDSIAMSIEGFNGSDWVNLFDIEDNCYTGGCHYIDKLEWTGRDIKVFWD